MAAAALDAIVVGGGFAGLSAALVLGRCRRNVIVIDAGRPRNAAATAIHGCLGQDGTAPQQLLERGRGEIGKYGVELRSDTVVAARKLTPGELRFPTAFEIKAASGQTARCRKLLFATGMRDELPKIEGIQECYGVTVHHCPYCDAWEHRDQRILVHGQEVHQAAELALALRGWSEQVTLLSNDRSVTDDDRLELEKHSIALREEPIVRFLHEGNRLRGAQFQSGATLAAEAMFCTTQQRSACELPQALGVARDDQFAGHTTRKQRTNVPGVFLAGDADGNVEFVAVAIAEGATAAVAINRELNEEDGR